MRVTVVGGGLAGCEAAWQLATRGIKVSLLEMRPLKSTPAHQTEYFAELVCSNSLGSNQITSAGGLLKEELKFLKSLIIEIALQTFVPAGGALAVDRNRFAQMITQRIMSHPNIEVKTEECTSLPEGIVIIATGPLSSEPMVDVLTKMTKSENLSFYDAAAPIVTGESILTEHGFWGARYGKGTPDYFNCPMTEEEYELFWKELVQAEQAPLHEGIEDDITVFEGCIPIEVMARRGKKTLLYGPLRPVGLIDERTGKRPFAVVQLRKENAQGSLFNLVGFQTRLKWGEQRRVFRLIPALQEAEFVRYGVMHRNTFINAPKVLKATFQLKDYPNVFVAGQLTGVEGYVESSASGLLAGINAARLLGGQEPLVLPEVTILGALARYLEEADPNGFQPMNANFGLLPPLNERIKDKQKRKEEYAKRSLDSLKQFLEIVQK